MTLKILKKPVVVPDLNYLQALPKGREHLSAKCFWVWPRRLFTEAADKGKSSFGYTHKLLRIYNLNASRSAVSGSLLDFCNDRITSKDVLDWDMVIDAELTQAVRNAAEWGETARFLSYVENINQQNAHKFNHFWMVLDFNRKTSKHKLPDTHRFLESIEADKNYITKKRAIENFIESTNYLGDDNVSADDVEADVDSTSPLITLWKIMLYIKLRWDTKPITDSELNDYDDIAYILISYLTGNIATADKALIRMIQVCAPNINFYPNTAIAQSA